MAFGIIEYNDKGLVKCEICGLYFNRVGPHVSQKHGILAKDYKKKYGFDNIKGLCSKKSAAKTRKTTLANYATCVTANLLQNGEDTRFVPDFAGRTKDLVRHQTLIRLRIHANTIAKKRSENSKSNFKNDTD